MNHDEIKQYIGNQAQIGGSRHYILTDGLGRNLMGIDINSGIRVIKVYPNPVSFELNIEFKGNKDRLSFNILNSVGQIVFKGNLSEKTVVQTTNFSPGVYIMKLENGSSFEFKKIVKV